METFEEKFDNFIKKGEQIRKDMDFAMLDSLDDDILDWINEAQIFYHEYLKDTSLSNKLDTLFFHGRKKEFPNILSCFKAIRKDKYFMDKINGIKKIEVPAYQAKPLPEYDVFISHANKDKEDFVDKLNDSIAKLGIKIFYDKKELEWGDNWKEKILKGTKNAEFAIIVISNNFFGREWTEKELNEFLNRQNRNGQKLILPILHNISIEDLKKQYPHIADIQAIDSKHHTTDEIGLLLAKQIIKRLKNE